uniref:Uncharacterized protein n=1 Tax=Parascaris equorum TaxID=6256 RepID=A0A914RB91_PAREQ
MWARLNGLILHNSFTTYCDQQYIETEILRNVPQRFLGGISISHKAVMFATLEPTIRQSCIRVLSIPNSTQQKISRHKGSGIELPYDLRPSFFIFIILFAGCSPVAGDYPRVVIMVEKYPDDSPWDFHSRSSRQAEISKKTWEEYILYKDLSF